MVVLALGLAVFRSIYLDGVPASVLPHDAAAVLYDTIAAVVLAALALVFWDRPTGKVVLGLTLTLLLTLAIIEFLGRPGPREEAVSTPT